MPIQPTGTGAVLPDVKETACHVRLCEKQVRRLIWRGELAAYRFGTALRIKKEDIDTYAESRRLRAG